MSFVAMTALLLLNSATWGIHRVDFEYQECFGCLDPSQWDTEYPACGGSRQSPQDLQEDLAEVCQMPIRFSNLLDDPYKVEVIHMLHTPLVKYYYHNPVTVYGGPLDCTYVFDHYNLRWGVDSTHGSEHTLDGKGFAGELQLVFFRNDTIGFHEAVHMPDGLAILSVWLTQVGSPDNAYFDELLGMLDYVTKPWSYTDLCNKVPLRYMLPDDRRRYFTYSGSLTYPPCPETVIWIIFQETLTMSKYQFLKLRRMIGVKGPIMTNVRPTCKSSCNIQKVKTPPPCEGE